MMALTGLVASFLLLPSGLYAQAVSEPPPPLLFSVDDNGVIAFDRDLLDGLSRGQTFVLRLPEGSSHEARVESIRRFNNGDLSWYATLTENSLYGIVLTASADFVYGSFSLPEGISQFSLHTAADGTRTGSFSLRTPGVQVNAQDDLMRLEDSALEPGGGATSPLDDSAAIDFRIS
ncbi:MAG: hypothetical protein RQ899_15385, partial [Pseudomonadales bacterium]|nr:hypothetical protein [Pseudomonadales bacterium]